MSLQEYRLNFKGPVRFGRSGIGLEESHATLPSDSLFSAFVNALLVSEGQARVEEFITACQDPTPPVRFSSLMPYGLDAEDKRAYAVHKPLTPPGELEYTKELRKLQWLTPEWAKQWLQGLPGKTSNDVLTACKDLTALKVEDKDKRKVARHWWKNELRPRVSLDRTTQNSNIWFCAGVTFIKDAGLYGLAQVRSDWEKTWQETMRMLGEMGLGGERTYGYGTYDITFEDLATAAKRWNIFSDVGKNRLLVSAYYPTDEERNNDLAGNMAAWAYEERRGFVTSGALATGVRRKLVTMLTEGSVFTAPLRGALAVVTPESGFSHPVSRSGLAFTLPLLPSDGEDKP